MATLPMVFLPERFHEQRSLADYSPWGHEESDATEQLKLQNFFKQLSKYYYCAHFLKIFKNSLCCFIGCAGSSLLPEGFLYLRQAGAILSCDGRAFHCGGFSCAARALGTWASCLELCRVGLVPSRQGTKPKFFPASSFRTKD